VAYQQGELAVERAVQRTAQDGNRFRPVSLDDIDVRSIEKSLGNSVVLFEGEKDLGGSIQKSERCIELPGVAA
jgi:hypothetical protein